MPSKRVGGRKGSAVKEIFHPPITRRPIDGARYANQWVAIWRREIIDADADLDALYKRLEAKGLEEKAGVLHVSRPGVRRI